jgi:hypothetical protein
MAAGDAGDEVGQVGLRVDVIELGGLGERSKDGLGQLGLLTEGASLARSQDLRLT